MQIFLILGGERALKLRNKAMANAGLVNNLTWFLDPITLKFHQI